MPLSGTGLGSILNSTSTPVKFGTVNRNTTKDQTVTIKNTGNAAAALSLASFSDDRHRLLGPLDDLREPRGQQHVQRRRAVHGTQRRRHVQRGAERDGCQGVPATAQVALTATTR